jgi:hypothetical protein
MLSPQKVSRTVRAVLCLSLLVGLGDPLAVASAAGPSKVAMGPPDVPAGGPSVLHSGPHSVPQLSNHDSRFRQPYELVSGTERYKNHEYLYTDYLYDDDLAAYPSDPGRYGGNAADLLEFRVAATRRALAFRFTLSTLLAKDSTIATLALNTDRRATTGSATLPRDPGMPFPGTDDVLTTWGTGAEWSHWTGRAWRTVSLPVRVELTANQITVTVPEDLARPRGKVGATLAVGLHDPRSHGWAASADPTSTSKILNLGFRFNEHPDNGVSPAAQQNAALKAGSPTAFEHLLDFDLLRRGGARDHLPRTGLITRMFGSRLHLGEGHQAGTVRPQLLSPVQPYVVYIPTTYRADRATPLTLNLHPLNNDYFFLRRETEQLWGEDRGNIVLSPAARGSDGWYSQWMEYDVFEAWNDLAQHYSLDRTRTCITGYSMGGYGTYRLGLHYPDLFARAATLAAPPAIGLWTPGMAASGGDESLSNRWLENARNLPYFNVTDTASESVPYTGQFQQNVGPPLPAGTAGSQAPGLANGFQSFDSLGYRYVWWSLTTDHLTIGADFPEIKAFLGNAQVEPAPFHVTYARMPSSDAPELGLVHNHAYWLSEIELFDISGGTTAKGVVDAQSLAFGKSDPTSKVSRYAGLDAMHRPYLAQQRTWSTPPAARKQNRLVLSLNNIGHVTVHLDRAELDLRRLVLDITATTPGTVALSDGARTRTISVVPGHTVRALS